MMSLAKRASRGVKNVGVVNYTASSKKSSMYTAVFHVLPVGGVGGGEAEEGGGGKKKQKWTYPHPEKPADSSSISSIGKNRKNPKRKESKHVWVYTPVWTPLSSASKLTPLGVCSVVYVVVCKMFLFDFF